MEIAFQGEAARSRRLAVAFTLLLTMITSVLPGQFFTSSVFQPLSPLAATFVYSPRLILIGDGVNFTAIASNGTAPYMIQWNFGDGLNGTGSQIFHRYASPGTYIVNLTVTDSIGQTTSTTCPQDSTTCSVTVWDWPVQRLGWVIRWNITNSDGINIWDVTYKGILVIRDVRLAGVQVLYRNVQGFGVCQDPTGPSCICGPFYDEPVALYGPAFNETLAKVLGQIFYENSPDANNPYFQLRAVYRVGEYYYQEIFRFYPDGRWDTEMLIGRGGCSFDHVYEPHWRFDLFTANDSFDTLSMYMPSGSWQDLLWEGNYTEDGFRDPAHNGSQWRFGEQGRYYFINSTIIRADLDLPYMPSNLILLRGRLNEIELSHPEVGIENPTEFVNGELAFRHEIVFWFIPRIWDHGPVSIAPPKDIILSFYPYGAWP